MIHTDKGFGIVNKAEIDAFLELSCFFGDPAAAAKTLQCDSVLVVFAAYCPFISVVKLCNN